jgi:hypothetical protein
MFSDSYASEDEPRAYVAPSWSNPNLHAQSGVFLHTRGFSSVGIEQKLTDLNQSRTSRGLEPIILRRYLLPHTEARALLRLLHLEGIHAAALFPAIGGVVQAMRERTFWDKPPA